MKRVSLSSYVLNTALTFTLTLCVELFLVIRNLLRVSIGNGIPGTFMAIEKRSYKPGSLSGLGILTLRSENFPIYLDRCEVVSGVFSTHPVSSTHLGMVNASWCEAEACTNSSPGMKLGRPLDD